MANGRVLSSSELKPEMKLSFSADTVERNFWKAIKEETE